MRKLVLLGLFVALASGCGRGWLPTFRGAPCYSGACGAAAPAMPASYDAACTGCGQASSFGSYNDGAVVGGNSYGGAIGADSYYDGGVIAGESYPSQGTIVSPSMSTLPQPAPAN